MRKNKKLVACAIAMLITALTLTVTTAAADQLSGTWKMNTEKSKYSPGPAPKDLTIVVDSDANNYMHRLSVTICSGCVQLVVVFVGVHHDGEILWCRSRTIF